jgi:hypothetical protein
MNFRGQDVYDTTGNILIDYTLLGFDNSADSDSQLITNYEINFQLSTFNFQLKTMDYFLTDNHLTPDPNDQMAIPTNIRSYTDDQIIDRIMQRGTTLTRPDLLAGIRAYQEEYGYIVEEGNGLNTGLINAGPNILGKFDSATDSYDHSRHKTHYSVNFSQAIREKVAKIKMNKVQSPNTGPLITAIRDSVSGLMDGTLSAGGALDIAGSRLKVFPGLPDNGVYFVASDGTEYKAATLVENRPSRLIVMLPALPSGAYTLEVRTHFISAATPGKQLRKAQFAKTLSI